MITGHLGIAGIVRSLAREEMSTGLVVAFALASIAPDIVDAAYFAFGICSPYGLYSHTLHAVALQAAVVGGVAYLATGSRVATVTFAAIVLLHIPADALTGRKLLMPGGEMTGLLLYEHPLYDFLLEVPTAVAGWWMLRRSGTAPRWATSAGVLLLALVVQATFDADSARAHRGTKPNACFASGSADASASPLPVEHGDGVALAANTRRDNAHDAVYVN